MPNEKPISLYGQTLTVEEWAKRAGMRASTLRWRLSKGMSLAEALSKPVDTRYSHEKAGRPRLDSPRKCPEMSQHRTGQARVRWVESGVKYDRYLGVWGSEEAKEAYRRFTIEWANGQAEIKSVTGSLMICELAAAYVDYARGYYVKAGRQTSEYHVVRSAMLALESSHGETLVDEFTADDLRVCVSKIIGSGVSRTTVNAYQTRIVRAFAWGAGQVTSLKRPYVPADVLSQVKHVPLQKAGRSGARESAKVKSVAWGAVEAIFPHLSDNEERRKRLEVAIRLLWLTGMRPGEMIAMRPMDIDQTESEWLYVVPPEVNKNAHRGTIRRVWLGPQSVELLKSVIAVVRPGDRIFSIPNRHDTDTMELTRDYFAKIIKKACKRAGITAWHPHQLRHSKATEVRRIYESNSAAARAIGGSEEVAKRVYVDPMDVEARRIARETG